MILKVLKILTVLSFVLITVDTGPLGDQFGIYLILGLATKNTTAIIPISILIVLFLYLRSAFKPIKNKDFLVFLIGGIVLFTPILIHIGYIVSKVKNPRDINFYVTASIFSLVYITTLFKLKNNKKDSLAKNYLI